MKSILFICVLGLLSISSNAQNEKQSISKASIKVQLENELVKVTLAVVSTSNKKVITQFSKQLSGENYNAVQKMVTLPSGKKLHVLEVYFQKSYFEKLEKNQLLMT